MFYPQHLPVFHLQVAFPIPFLMHHHVASGVSYLSAQVLHEITDRMARNSLRQQSLYHRIIGDHGSIYMVHLFSCTPSILQANMVRHILLATQFPADEDFFNPFTCLTRNPSTTPLAQHSSTLYTTPDSKNLSHLFSKPLKSGFSRFLPLISSFLHAKFPPLGETYPCFWSVQY
jgi:hypothetical protein